MDVSSLVPERPLGGVEESGLSKVNTVLVTVTKSSTRL